MEKSIDALASKINSRSAPNRYAKCREFSIASSYSGDPWPRFTSYQWPKKNLPGPKPRECKYRRFTNGKEAYELLSASKGSINLVLTDYNMPDGTGYDLLLRIRQNSEIANIPVIFLTTESNPEAIVKAKEAKLNAWIKKPYRAESFFDQIHRALFPTIGCW